MNYEATNPNFLARRPFIAVALLAGSVLMTACGASRESAAQDGPVVAAAEPNVDTTNAPVTTMERVTTTTEEPTTTEPTTTDSVADTEAPNENETTTTVADDDVEDEGDPGSENITYPDTLQRLTEFGYTTEVVGTYDTTAGPEDCMDLFFAVARDWMAVNNTENFDGYADMFGLDSVNDLTDQAGLQLFRQHVTEEFRAYMAVRPDALFGNGSRSYSEDNDYVYCSAYGTVRSFEKDVDEAFMEERIMWDEKNNELPPTSGNILYLGLEFAVDKSTGHISLDHPFHYTLGNEEPTGR